MKKNYKDPTPSISLTVLATLCFVTLVMCQTRFKITKELSQELHPPVLRSKDCWFLYTIGNPDRFKCVLRAFIVLSSPVLSLISTGLLLFGKIESNPYLFIPWLFLTIKGLLLIQTDNLVTILKEMTTKGNYAFGFRMEDMKWMLFYFTIFMIDLVEAFSFCEIFDIFLALWNHHPGYDAESSHLEVMKKEINEIMETFSKCSLRSLSKVSLGSITGSDEPNDIGLKVMGSLIKLNNIEEEALIDRCVTGEAMSKGDAMAKTNSSEKLSKKDILKELKSYDIGKLETICSEGDATTNEAGKYMKTEDLPLENHKNSSEDNFAETDTQRTTTAKI